MLIGTRTRAGGVAAFTLALAVAIGSNVALATDGGTDVGPSPSSEGTKPAPSPGISGVAISLDQPFTLEVGETATLGDDFSVRFVSVDGDSRCPTDVQCVWEGDAEIALEVATSNAGGAPLALHTNPGFTTQATYLSYAISLGALEPYPRTNPKTDTPYMATLVVTTTEEESDTSSQPSAVP
jgi:hypothetical protein